MLTLTLLLKTADDLAASDALSEHLLTHLPADWPDEREEAHKIAFADTPEPRVMLMTRWLGNPGDATLTDIMNRWFLRTTPAPDLELLHYQVQVDEPKAERLTRRSPAPADTIWTVEQADQHALTLVDPEGWYEAQVKWDGCVHFTRYFNFPRGDAAANDAARRDTLHICELDEMIARLQALKAAALAHFGPTWE